ncbi:MAG TPA: hypothetical protein VEK07_05725 [Polyangiaceae bacterium]|nr:hypothetical protein [Polyangiaceae bacterium]
MIPTRNYPRYIQRSINALMLQTPALAKGVTLYFFPVGSDITKQQAICDKFLNDPSRKASELLSHSQGASNYRAFFPQVFFFFATYGSLQSLEPPDSDRGGYKYLEAGIWIPTVFEPKDANVLGSHLAMFPYYMFVNTSAPLAVGRELQGWDKEWAELGIPDRAFDADEFSISPVLIKRFSAESYGVEGLLAQFRRVGDRTDADAGLLWTEARAALKAIKRLVFKDMDPWIPGLALSIFGIPVRGLTFTFLKQFRDVRHPHHACYQSGVEATISIREFRGLGTLHGEYELNVTRADSHPLVDQMGLDESTFSRIHGFYAELDFVLHTGFERWRHP